MSKKNPTKHFYGIFPNGGYPAEEYYMVNWCTRDPEPGYALCYVPAAEVHINGERIYFGCHDSLEKCLRDTARVSGGEYDVILYKRCSDDARSDDYWRFEPERFVMEGTATGRERKKDE